MDNKQLGYFFAKVADSSNPNSCWEWVGAKSSAGYGQMTLTNDGVRRKEYAHRLSYREFVGQIASNKEIDHLCRNRSCVNPTHLEAVTRKVNNARGESPSAKNLRKMYCPQGHPYAGSNLCVSKEGHRFCRTCKNLRHKLWLRKKRQGVGAT